jgi:hypothetical protein
MTNGLSLLENESSLEFVGEQNPICTSGYGFFVLPQTNAYEAKPKFTIRGHHKTPTQIFLLIGLVGRFLKHELPFRQ